MSYSGSRDHCNRVRKLDLVEGEKTIGMKTRDFEEMF
jgi:hypothetical protein